MTGVTKKVLLLGGTGAIGVYAVPELLRSGFEVFVTSRNERASNERKLHYVLGDAKEDEFLEQLLKEHEFDAIIDFMIYTTDEFEKRIDNLLASTKHYLFLSSYRVYADSGDELLDEASPRLLDTVKDEAYLATDEYGLTKARQENLLRSQKKRKNWTILRPAITYSNSRFQLGTMEGEEFVARALKGKRIVFPREMLGKYTTMTWAGDVGSMIARLVANKASFGETYTLATAENKKWSDVVKLYKELLRARVKLVSLEEYQGIVGRPYQIKYDRMYDRRIDNTKILAATGMSQGDLMPLREGLRIELSSFSRAPKYKSIDTRMEKRMDTATASVARKLRNKLHPRTRLRQAKRLIDSRVKFAGAIVTLTVYNNYGNVIQRFALQHFLNNHGYRFTMLDLKTGSLNPRHKKLKEFADQYLTQELFDPRASKFYKTYIVGSDQVWRNFSINKGWNSFSIQFLDFVKSETAKRIAYAASFGVDTLDEAAIDATMRKKVRPLIRNFDAISVREHSGINLVEQLGGKEAVQVLDPTLLLSANDYTKLINTSSIANQESKDVFYYLIQQTPLTEATIKHYEAVFSSSSKGILPYADPSVATDLPSVEEWLKSIRDAKIVVTDSYHAIVFSIIFHTDFIVFDKQKGGLARIAELLEPLGLSDRIIIQGNTKKYTARHKTIDWEKVDRVLNKKRAASAEWLLKSLKK